MYQRILVATDNSDLSHKATRAAIVLAGRLGAALVVVHVVPRYPVSYFEGAVGLSTDEVARVEKEWMDKGRAAVDAVAAHAKAEGVDARGVLAQSDVPADAILATAQKHHCDLIVMASHGRRGISRVLLGSETQNVLAHSKIPVLVLR
jgi:nucleotide-binding universal stress UspA family protein